MPSEEISTDTHISSFIDVELTQPWGSTLNHNYHKMDSSLFRLTYISFVFNADKLDLLIVTKVVLMPSYCTASVDNFVNMNFPLQSEDM